MSRESLTASWYQTFVVYQLVKSFYPQIIAICVIHSIIVGLRLELSGLGRQWCFAMSNSGVVYSVSKLKFCYDKHGSHVLSFMSL